MNFNISLVKVSVSHTYIFTHKSFHLSHSQLDSFIKGNNNSSRILLFLTSSCCDEICRKLCECLSKHDISYIIHLYNGGKCLYVVSNIRKVNGF